MTEGPLLQSNPFNYDFDDLVALSKLIPMGSAQLIRIAAGAIVILLGVTLVAEAWALTGLIDWTAVVVFVLIASLLLLASNRKLQVWLRLRIARRSPLYAPHSYAITPTALRVSSVRSSTDVKWTTFHDVRRVDDRLFVFMTKRQAFIVPSRAFDSVADFEAFAAAAHDRWKQRHRL